MYKIISLLAEDIEIITKDSVKCWMKYSFQKKQEISLEQDVIQRMLNNKIRKLNDENV